MKARAKPSGPTSPAAKSEAGPRVLSIIETMDEPRRSILIEVRNLALSLPGVAETTLYDGFCRHWTPAYYVGESQLFHLHNFRAGLRATVFAGGKRLAPMILDSAQVPQELRLQLAKSSQGRGIKQVKVTLGNADDVAALLELARLKRESLQ